MATIKELSVSLIAQTSKFEKDMVKASSILSTFQMNVGELAGKMVDLGAAGIAGAAVGIGYLVATTTEALTTQARFAEQTGLSTEMMAGFQVAARTAGVGTEESSKALEHFTKTMGAAINGSDTAQKTFSQLGLDYKELAAHSPDEQLQMVADAFADIPDKASAALSAQELFGKSGQAMVNVLAQGSDGLMDATQKAIDYGIALSDVESKQILQATEAIEDMKLQAEGAANTLAVQFAPFVRAAADELSKLGKSGGGMAKMVVDGFEWVLQAVAKAADWFALLLSAAQAMGAGISVAIGLVVLAESKWLYAAEAVWNFITRSSGHAMSDELKAFSDGMIEQAKDMAVAAKQNWDTFTSGANEQKVSNFFDKIRANSKKAAEDALIGSDAKHAAAIDAAHKKALENDAEEIKAAKEKQKLLDEMQKKADEMTKSLRTGPEKLQEGIKLAMEYLEKGMITQETFNREVEKLKKDYADAIPKDMGNKSAFKTVDTSLINIQALSGGKKAQKTEIKSEQLEVANKIATQMLSELRKKPVAVLAA